MILVKSRPRCLFLDSPYPFDEVYPPPLLERLGSLVEVVHPTAGSGPAHLEDVHVCVGWDGSTPMAEMPGSVELVVHCGLFPRAVFPSIEVPDSWADAPSSGARPGPRSWSSAGMRRAHGGHRTGASGQEVTFGDGPRLEVVAEPIERGIAEKLLSVAIIAACDRSFGSRGDTDSIRLDSDFYDITVGVVGWGGAAPAFCRLLRNFEVGLMLYDPDMYAQPTGELGARYCDDATTVAREADLVVLFPYKDPRRPLAGAELWAERPVGSRMIAVDEDLVADAVLTDFKGRAYVGSRKGGESRLAGESAVTPIYGLSHLLPNSLGRVGREVVDAVHRYVAAKTRA